MRQCCCFKALSKSILGAALYQSPHRHLHAMEIDWHCYVVHWLVEISPICPSIMHLEGASSHMTLLLPCYFFSPLA